MARTDPPYTIDTGAGKAPRRPDERPRRVSLELPGDALAVRAARRMVESAGAGLPEPTRARLNLLVTELVANGVVHGPGGRTWIRLDLMIEPELVRVEVVDAGNGFRLQPPPGEVEREGGFGLVLVDRLADRWGVSEGGATRVWAEIRRRPL